MDDDTYLPTRRELEDYYEVKEVDRRLSYFLVTSSSITCDVGGSIGIDALPLARLGSLCICVDINKGHVKAGKTLSKKKVFMNKLEFVVASATHLPFKDSSLDLVTCFSVLDHLPSKEDACLAVNEFSRVVRDFKYVVVTVPNRLFLIGTVFMRLKQLLDSDAYFEQRFTPQEMQKMMVMSGLTPLALDSKYPTSARGVLKESNLPRIMSKIPPKIFDPVLLIAESVSRKLEKRIWLRLFGARFGYLSQKRVDNYDRSI
ncbi:MAG: class I SAM-dependent methyltransferase [Candidatus Bathyarchaeia archaeon]|jgi:hypothetical protein